jgi:hypothetical protein
VFAVIDHPSKDNRYSIQMTGVCLHLEGGSACLKSAAKRSVADPSMSGKRIKMTAPSDPACIRSIRAQIRKD